MSRDEIQADIEQLEYLTGKQYCVNRETGYIRRTLRSQRTQETRFVEHDDEFQTLKNIVSDLQKLPESVKVSGSFFKGER